MTFTKKNYCVPAHRLRREAQISAFINQTVSMLRASRAPELARSEKRCREIPQDNQTSFPHPRNLPIQ